MDKAGTETKVDVAKTASIHDEHVIGGRREKQVAAQLAHNAFYAHVVDFAAEHPPTDPVCVVIASLIGYKPLEPTELTKILRELEVIPAAPPQAAPASRPQSRSEGNSSGSRSGESTTHDHGERPKSDGSKRDQPTRRMTVQPADKADQDDAEPGEKEEDDNDVIDLFDRRGRQVGSIKRGAAKQGVLDFKYEVKVSSTGEKYYAEVPVWARLRRSR